MYAVQQHLHINAGIVKMVCEGINNCKSCVSKKDKNNYKFEYIKKDDLPDDYIKSTNKRYKPVLSDEDKKKHKKESIKRWQQKKFICSKCNKTYKNSYKCVHNKKCKIDNQK